jgi:hypothetical protein
MQPPSTDAAAPTDRIDFLVRRDELSRCELTAAPAATLAPGQVELAIDHFAFSANNVTYAVVGEAFGYWKFFPARGEGWGRIPVWGFGTVVATAHDEVPTGARFYGYYPTSSHVVLEPRNVASTGFLDGAAHRRELPGIYNEYLATGADPLYRADTEPQQMLMRPLFTTAFLLDDLLGEDGFRDAGSVVFSSASSKTAFATASLLAARRQRGADVEVVGLTSPANAPFVRHLGVYDRVALYDDVASLPRDRRAVYVDMAGSATVRVAVHRHFGDALRQSIVVGGTHRAAGRTPELPGPAPRAFFAPDRARKRREDWTPDVLRDRVSEAWGSFLVPLLDPVRGWMRVARATGPEAIERVYREVLDGRSKPDVGHVLSFGAVGA